ncbi:MAG: hypothetical protein IKG46_02540 [Solobacterium sp.]|nr:hypothetical protein [Solobacterium sp.]
MVSNHWKADEMERSVNLRAMQYAWAFLLVSLMIWVIAEYMSTGELLTIPLILILISNMIFFSVKLWLTKRMTAPGSENNEE